MHYRSKFIYGNKRIGLTLVSRMCSQRVLRGMGFRRPRNTVHTTCRYLNTRIWRYDRLTNDQIFAYRHVYAMQRTQQVVL